MMLSLRYRRKIVTAAVVIALSMLGGTGIALSPLFVQTAHAESATTAQQAAKGQKAADEANAAKIKATNDAKTAGASNADAIAAGNDAYNKRIQAWRDQEAAEPASDSNHDQCLYFFGLNIVQCVWDIGLALANIFLQAAIFFLATAGSLLDTALQFLSFNMGAILKAKAISDAISYGWGIIRDIGNLALIAGLIWASIAMILGINAGTHPPGKLIVNVIIVAILVNFSYFFAGVLIDASNGLSRMVYEEGIKGVAVGAGTVALPGPLARFNNLSITQHAFSGFFIQKTKLVSVINTSHDKSKPFISIISIGFAITLISMTGVVFTEAAFLIILRFAILVLLLVTSPLFVLGFTNLESLKKWGSWWWKTLVSQLVFLPVFMLLMMISFNTIGKLMDYAAARTRGATLASVIDGADSGNGGTLAAGFEVSIFFFVSLALLYISIKVARDLATGAEMKMPNLGQFQEMASKAGQTVGKFGQKYVAGFPAEAAGLGYRELRKLPVLSFLNDWEKGAGRGWREFRSNFGGPKNKADIERERREETRLFGGKDKEGNQVVGKADEALAKIHKYEEDVASAQAAYDAETDPEKKAVLAQGLKIVKDNLNEAENKFAKAVNDMYEVDPEKTAAYIHGLGPKEQDAAMRALGNEKAHEVTEMWKSGRGRSSGRRNTEGGPDGEANAPQLTAALRGLGDRLVSSDEAVRTQAHRDYAALEYVQQRLLYIERRELHTAQHMESLAKAVGPERFGQHIADMPAAMIAKPGVRAGIAPHVTIESYTKLRDRLVDEGKHLQIHQLNQELGKHENTRHIVDDYNKAHPEQK